MSNLDLVTIIIIAANIIISYKGFGDYAFFERYKFNVGGVQRGEKIRVFSSGFLHVDTQHLLFNMLTLYFFAGTVIDYVAPIGFMVIYIVSLVAGSLLSLYFHKNEYHYSAVGASGAVTGILYAAILFWHETYIFFHTNSHSCIFIWYRVFAVFYLRDENPNRQHWS